MAAFSRTVARSVALLAMTLALAGTAHAAEPATPATSGGSPDVIVNGKPAERAGDRPAATGMPAETSPNVFINGKPASIGCR